MNATIPGRIFTILESKYDKKVMQFLYNRAIIWQSAAEVIPSNDSGQESALLCKFTQERLKYAYYDEIDKPLEACGVRWDTIIECYHTQSKELEGYALFDSKNHYLLYLLTNPKNLVGAEKVRGVGTAIIQYLAKKVLQNREKPIQLKAHESAVGFYKAKGFTKNNTLRGIPNHECLELTYEKAIELIN